MNQMYTTKKILINLFMAIAMIVLVASFALADLKPRQNEGLLLDAYRRNMTRLKTNNLGLPLVVESFERDNKVHVDVYGIFDHPYSTIVNVLNVPANWCAIVSLPPNIKACTYKELNGAWLLTFYLGRKEYQPLEDTRQMNCRYRKVEQQEGYLDIMLAADQGPFGTKAHKMRFEALALDGGKTFVHVSYAYSDSGALRLASKIYFATLGRSKVGFTVTGTGKNGKPVYIGGPRGAVERNAVRYYFAIQSFMDTVRYPEDTRFGMRLSEWYALTSRYKTQLFDLDKKDYLSFKIREHKNQVAQQRRIELGLE